MPLDRGRSVVVHSCSTLSACCQLVTKLNAEVQKNGINWGFSPTEGDRINGSRRNLARNLSVHHGSDLVHRPTVYVYVPNFVSIGLLCRPLLTKTPNFCHFWISAFSGVANWQLSQKVEHGCTAQIQTFPIKLNQNRFCTPSPSWRNRAHNL